MAGGAVCERCAAGSIAISPAGLAAIEGLLRAPMADASRLTDPGARDALKVVTASYEHHGGFRLRTLSA